TEPVGSVPVDASAPALQAPSGSAAATGMQAEPERTRGDIADLLELGIRQDSDPQQLPPQPHLLHSTSRAPLVAQSALDVSDLVDAGDTAVAAAAVLAPISHPHALSLRSLSNRLNATQQNQPRVAGATAATAPSVTVAMAAPPVSAFAEGVCPLPGSARHTDIHEVLGIGAAHILPVAASSPSTPPSMLSRAGGRLLRPRRSPNGVAPAGFATRRASSEPTLDQFRAVAAGTDDDADVSAFIRIGEVAPAPAAAPMTIYRGPVPEASIPRTRAAAAAVWMSAPVLPLSRSALRLTATAAVSPPAPRPQQPATLPPPPTTLPLGAGSRLPVDVSDVIRVGELAPPPPPPLASRAVLQVARSQTDVSDLLGLAAADAAFVGMGACD
ncbi:hypothetical protein HK405_000707, partial [Cladochytrium tenue]